MGIASLYPSYELIVLAEGPKSGLADEAIPILVLVRGARGTPCQSVRLSVLSAQTLMPDASIDSPSSNVPRRSKRQSLACDSLADACLPDFTGPTTLFHSAEPDSAASD